MPRRRVARGNFTMLRWVSAVAAMMRATPPEGKEFAMKKNMQTAPVAQVETPAQEPRRQRRHRRAHRASGADGNAAY